MMLVLVLYLDIVWYSLAMSANFTTATQSKHIDKRGLREDLNNFESAVPTFLPSRFDSSIKGHSKMMTELLMETKNWDKNEVRQDEELKGRFKVPRPEIPTVIDLAFPTQKQWFKNKKYVSKTSLGPAEGESKERQQKGPYEKKALEVDNILLGTSEDRGTKVEQKYSSERKRKVKPGKDKIQSRKKDLKVLMDEFRRTNSTAQKDLAIPDAIDLAFNKGHRNSATTAKPTTLYWPPTTTSSPTPNQFCRSKIDLGFLVEASKTVARTGPGNYRRLLDFIKHVVLKFAIGPTATRIGVISYANRPILMMGFNDGENIHDVLRFLNLPCHHCWNAHTGLALTFAQSYLYGCSCSLRKRVLIVVTDGSSSDDVHIPSRILKQNGVQIITVGAGRYFNIHQLNAMASRPAKKNVFTGDFSKIHHFTNELVRQICDVADGTMVPNTTSPCQCP